jgi:hypothetical protein
MIDYLCSLAADGETFLIVKQKPKGEGFSYPAFLPHKYAPGGGWYGNTGSYILDRFRDGHVSASSANIEHVLVMVLDDIGTKSKEPPLPPTWIMETSPGNFQWGYTFSDQPTKHQFAAAIIAIAAAGYTDPGAINPVRNFRIPGSVNHKNGFVSRLVEMHKDREYTLAEICTALQVTPAEANSGSVVGVAVDAAPDDVIEWLSGRGEVLERGNSSGWWGVKCPNSAEHSDDQVGARYLPATRAFACFHGHCLDWDSVAFLRWVADSGGPQHMHGFRAELMATMMQAVSAKLNPSPEYPDRAAEIIASVEQRELGRMEKADWWSKWAYVQDDESFFSLEDRRLISRATFNAIYRHISCVSIHGAKPRRVEASICYDENRQVNGAHSLTGITYAAGSSMLVSREGLVYGNRWRDQRPTPVAGDANPWLRHVARMIPDAAERAHFLSALAHKVQYPGIKINHAILLGGNHGSGKDTLMAPFFWAIGGATKSNCSLVKNDELTSQWGYALECEVMEIAELRQSQAQDRRAIENTLKPLIAAPPELLPVNRKGLHPYLALNRIFVVAFTNERGAISLPSEDRRWFVLWSDADRLSEADAGALWNWYTRQDGFGAVAHYLMTYDVSAWCPTAPPPMTEAKMILIDAAMSPAEAALVSAIRNRIGDFRDGVICGPFHAILDRVQFPAHVKTPPQAALFHALKEAGWVDMGRLHSRDYSTKKHIFRAPELAGVSKSDLRVMVETKKSPA